MERNRFDVIEDAEQVRLDRVRIARLAENLEQGRVGDEEEARKDQAFLFQIAASIQYRNWLPLSLRYKDN